LEFVGSYDVGLTCRMAATCKPAVGAEIWACSLALEGYTTNRPIRGETKTIDRIAATRLLLSRYECAVAALFRDECRLLPLMAPLPLYSEPRLDSGMQVDMSRDSP